MEVGGPIRLTVGDWCEENYRAHWAIAEFWNTLSSFALVALPLYGLTVARRYIVAERRWDVAYSLFLLVGVGSTLFHATLWRVFQALDELPMLYATLAFAYCLMEESEKRRHSRLPAILTAVGAFETALYVAWPNLFGIFLLAYVTSLVALTYRTFRLAARRGFKTAQWRVARGSATWFGFGAACWITEAAFCHKNLELFQHVQLHALWHILAAQGTWLFIQWMLLIRAERLRFRPELRRGLWGLIVHAVHSSPD